MRAKNMELNQGSIITWTSIGCCLHRMDVPVLCPQKALPALPKSIAASSFKFVLIPSPAPAHLKSICRSMPRCSLLQHRIPAARSLIWSGWHRSLYPEAIISRIPSIIPVSTSNKRRYLHGCLSFKGRGGQISMCTINAWSVSPPQSRPPPPHLPRSLLWFFIILLQLG